MTRPEKKLSCRGLVPEPDCGKPAVRARQDPGAVRKPKLNETGAVRKQGWTKAKPGGKGVSLRFTILPENRRDMILWHS